MRNRDKNAGQALAVLFWIGIWFLGAGAVDNEILLASPAETTKRFVALLGDGRFYGVAACSFVRIGAGFLAGAGLAAALAAGCARFPALELLFAPPVNLIKTVPVASFAVMLLIWWGSDFLTAAVCFLAVFPNVYFNVLEGLKNVDGGLLEMAEVFRLPFWNRFFYIYRPSLKPFLYGGLKISLGMCWKAGAAAEVIGIPSRSIGERLYLSKVHLDTAGVFAWTAVIVALGFLTEKLVMGLVEGFFRWEPACKSVPARRGEGVLAWDEEALCFEGIRKSYDGRTVLEGVSGAYEPGGVYYLRSPSGSGKTTLLRILAGLTEPDGGRMQTPAFCSMVFQEDRLCDEYSAVKNVELVTGDFDMAKDACGILLEEDALHKPCGRLSGGMRRRVALVRAMEADSSFVLLDEPFAGMDAKTRLRAEEYIRERQKGRVLLIASHV